MQHEIPLFSTGTFFQSCKTIDFPFPNNMTFLHSRSQTDQRFDISSNLTLSSWKIMCVSQCTHKAFRGKNPAILIRFVQRITFVSVNCVPTSRRNLPCSLAFITKEINSNHSKRFAPPFSENWKHFLLWIANLTQDCGSGWTKPTWLRMTNWTKINLIVSWR